MSRLPLEVYKEAIQAAAGAADTSLNLIVSTATGTVTLLPISSNYRHGTAMWVKNASGGAVTVAATSPDTIDSGYTALATGQAVHLAADLKVSPPVWRGLIKPQ